MSKIGSEYIVASAIDWRMKHLCTPSVLVDNTLISLCFNIRDAFKKNNHHPIIECFINDIADMVTDYIDWFEPLYLENPNTDTNLYKISLKANRTIHEMQERFLINDEDIQLIQKITNETFFNTLILKKKG